MSLTDDMPKRIMDQKAETASELCKATGYNDNWVYKYAKEQVAAGRWEKVYKRVGDRIVPAFRRKK